uniref:Transmembrane protein 238a n=1 Tax=Oryzias latipes TaxID=8090 RepID=A0A3P9JMF9_ORYLA
MTPNEGLSHCKLALAFAVIMDLLGGAALLVGVFARLQIKGQDYGDLLVYSGALLVVVSLAGWVLWYSGNIEGLTTKKELGHIGSAVDRLARTLSRKMRTQNGQAGQESERRMQTKLSSIRNNPSHPPQQSDYTITRFRTAETAAVSTLLFMMCTFTSIFYYYNFYPSSCYIVFLTAIYLLFGCLFIE